MNMKKSIETTNVLHSSKNSLPDFLQPFLWSYDISTLEKRKNFRRIATNLLIYGDEKAISWLFSNFESDEIKSVIENPMKGEWDKKSLSFWSSIFDIQKYENNAIKNLHI